LSASDADSRLKREGIDPTRIAVRRFGWPKHLQWHGYPPWTRPMFFGLALWALFQTILLAYAA